MLFSPFRDGRTVISMQRVLSSLKGLEFVRHDFPSVKTLGYFQEKDGASMLGMSATLSAVSLNSQLTTLNF